MPEAVAATAVMARRVPYNKPRAADYEGDA
jgi:hypothetical protein